MPSYVFLAPEQTANLFPTVTLVHILRTVGSFRDFTREIEAKPTGKTALITFDHEGNCAASCKTHDQRKYAPKHNYYGMP